nr:TonB-dependent receptor [Gemmatimonadaceae bacterium]
MIAPFVVAFLQVVPQAPATPRTAPDSTRPRLAPVVVTAERPRAAPPPVAVTTVAPEALRRAAGATAYDAVRRAAGLEVHEQGQGPGFTSNVVLRGFNSDHSADVLLTVDGVPINSPIHGHVEGFSDWNILLPAAVSSFRVVHGGASPLYGDFSLAGVAEVFTAADAVGAAHAVRSSSFGDVGYTGRTGLRRATWGALAAIDARRDQGWQPNGAASLGNVLLRGWRTAWGGRLEGGVQAYTSRWRSPGFVSISRYNLGRFDEAVDTTDGGWSQRLIAHARYARPLGTRTQLEATAWGQTSAYRMRLNLPGQALALRQAEERDERTGAGGRVQVVRSLLRGEGVLGVEGRADVADYGFDATLGGSFVTREHAYDARFASGAAFARWRTLIASRLLVDVGGRLDALSYRSFDLLRPNAGWREGTQLIPTPKLGASWFARDGLVVRSSFSRGFRGAPGVIADPTRAPFLAWASELGTTWERGALS